MHEFRAYCDICKEPVRGWRETKGEAIGDRGWHFEFMHPDNPMVKTNCRIQRRSVEVD